MARQKKYKSKVLESLVNEISKNELERTESKMLLAMRIKNGMIRKGMSNTDLADILKKKTPQITKWLSGTHNFTHDTLFDIGRVLDIKLVNSEEKKDLANPHFNIQIRMNQNDRSTTDNVAANQTIINNIPILNGDC